MYSGAQTENAKSMSYQGLSQRRINEKSVYKCVSGHELICMLVVIRLVHCHKSTTFISRPSMLSYLFDISA